MTLTLSPELAAIITAAADRAGLPPEAVALDALQSR